jgi:AcrR family transcriptional regulator
MSNDKDRNEKKQEFLDVALELFYEKGYEKTTINDIINKLGVSKGAFYHYFQSKEDIIETIAIGYADKMSHIIKKILNRTDINAIEKFNISIELTQDYKKSESDRRTKIKGSLRNDENLKLQKKIMDKISEKYVVFYDQIVKEGIEQKLFQVSYSKELPRFILKMAHGLNESIDELIQRAENENMNRDMFFKELEEKSTFYEDAFRRILNLKESSIILKKSTVKRFK